MHPLGVGEAMSKIAILVDQMFEDSEFRVPCKQLKAAGHEVEILGLERGKQLAGKHGNEHATIERAVADARAADYDAPVIPGGYSPDHLRMDADAVRFTREMAGAHKLVAAVCHAPWMLIEAELARGRTVTSWPSLKTDLVNAGAQWVDREVVEDGNWVTSRQPGDLPAFNRAMLTLFSRSLAASHS